MKTIRFLFILHFAFCILHFSFGQQYGWTDISHNLPDYPYDTTIINNGEDTIISAIHDINFINDQEGWLATWHPFSDQEAAILHTADGGLTWDVQSVLRPCQGIHMVDADTGYAVSDGGMIFMTSDGGDHWDYYGNTFAPFRGMSFVPGTDTGYICSHMSANLQQITAGGINPIPLGDSGWWRSISTPSNALIWLCYGAGVYTFDEEGLTDQPTSSSSLNSIYFVKNDLGWGCGNEGVRNRNEGTIEGCVGKNIPWVLLRYTEQPMNKVFALDENHVWAVGYEEYIYFSENASEFGFDTITSTGWNNVVFTQQPNPRPDAAFISLFFTSPTNGFAGAGNNILLKYGLISGEEEKGGQGDKENGIVEVYPNPGRGIYSLQFTNYNLESGVIELMDLNGKVLEHWNPGTLKLDLSKCPAGIYLIRINFGNEWIVRKIVKL